MYRVGFGDFFLLSVRGKSGGFVHVLIDCGVHAADLGCIGDAINQLAADTQKQLALVIMTHRHADHISGFARGKDVFSQFSVERVWMPWFENPKNATAVALQQNLAAVAIKLERQLALRAAPDDHKFQNMMSDISSVSAGGSNAIALDVLHGGFQNKAPVDYYQAGDGPTLPPSLVAAGVSARILGPPIDPNLIAQMDNKSHQYLSMADADPADAVIHPFAPVFAAGDKAYPDEAFALFDAEAIETSIANSQPDMLAARAQRADNTLNNQSLVVLFEIAGKKLLFAGDAQWGNWANFLFGGKVSASGQSSLTAESKAILGAIDFYKVGHHGSTNATPIDALEAMRSGLVAMCSTEPGAYGSEKNNSEVPRKPLIAALQKRTGNRLAMSTEVAVKGTAAEGPLPSMFQSPQQGVIDYYFA
jgi:beta-lactamase superfamily II metal-dependent hydrolase